MKETFHIQFHIAVRLFEIHLCIVVFNIDFMKII